MASSTSRRIQGAASALAGAWEQRLVVVTPLDWVGLAVGAATILAGLLWSFCGSIPTTVSGQGLLLRHGGLHEVVAVHGGQIVEMVLEPGDLVRRGQVLAHLARPELAETVQRLRKGPSEALAEAEARLVREANLISPCGGRVVEVRVKPGEVLAPGMVVAVLEDPRQPLEVLIYLPPRDGKRVRPGMEVDLSPSTVRREEHGSALGLVAEVSAYPASPEAMQRVLGNERLVEALSAGGAPIVVRADLLPDPRTPTGVRWTTAPGPAGQLQSGTPCSATVTVERRRPIALVLPWLGQVLGL